MLAAMVRVAELLGSLSLATDLADGFSLEKSLRTTILAARISTRVGAAPHEQALAYWTALLRFAGCTAFAHEEATLYADGDDLGLRRTLAYVDFGRPRTFITRALTGIARHASPRVRIAALTRLLGDPGAPRAHAHAQCEVAVGFARAIGRPDVAAALDHREERWDGKGPRRQVAEAELPLAARIADVADTLELFSWSLGVEAAIEELRARRGGHLDPHLVDACLGALPPLLVGLDEPSVWDLFLSLEPTPQWTVEAMEPLLRAYSRFADVASVYTLGHSAQVAELAGKAAAAFGLGAEEQCLARWAGYTHDLGRVGVATGLWEKVLPLSMVERQRIRGHSHHTETILSLSPALGPVLDVAAATHERGGGRGYPRRQRLEGLAPVARVLAAADVYVALISTRPHRPAFGAPEAVRLLRSEATSGALERTAVEAVLAATGQRRPARSEWPGGLSDREVQVVRLVAIGRSNPEIGQLLGMSPRTAQKHVMHVYQKLGLESRAGLALWAMEHQLLEP
jgi:HD-GYP domain-containing protein (c-di-GMP phosphodiesterase class II)